ncbi:MAG: bifunctional folylpolyglutamate synthase/dihydrofolate synthase [Kineosporiaceae bacterium]|nr:bifunctional folylpolyglutamate synthase/dihydrofolate synthase [Kineosporiaceae bacterium]MBK7621662.1 bifunctional folylpolyglutamate synthase/dihydrofolate synthase [Kineosporiaceae bacterium]MBK8077168.1 bifunctional folylpolyglutamate synthase/dihydrofolate synthase [Kineosporiaceae bacterium]
MTDTDPVERLEDVYRAILSRAPEHDLVPSLDRIRAVTELMGDPQTSLRAVHLTGTNGKTSTTRIVERLLREHGLRTGRFVSPHLSDVRERIAIDGEPLSPERFVEVYDEIAPYLDLVDARSAERGEPRMTFFEVLVAMAYAAFADAPAEVAVIEVGMGGSWDATNVIDAEVAVITPIAIDHQHFLGHEISQIATEKAGIIKPGAVAIIADQDSHEAAEILLRRAAEVGATVAREGLEFGVAGREVAIGGQLLTLQGLGGIYEDLFLPLHGIHQAQNAVCALAAVEAFLGAGPSSGRLDPDVVRAAFAGVDSPGRLEVVRRSPTIMVDAAHNPAGAQALADSIDDAFGFARLIGVVGVMADKDVIGILDALQPVLDEVVVTRSASPRAMAPDELAEIAREVFGEDRVHVADRLDSALDLAVARAEVDHEPGAGVLVTGSIPLAGEVRTLLRVDR